jgi:lysozyme
MGGIGMRDNTNLINDLIRDEGVVLHPYKDSKGILTIGCGHNLEARPLTVEQKIRYCDSAGNLTPEGCRGLLNDDINDTIADLFYHLPWVNTDLTLNRQDALANMAFNMGIGNAEKGTGLLGFKNSLALLEAGKYEEAADNFLKSRWAAQVGSRAVRVTDALRNG